MKSKKRTLAVLLAAACMTVTAAGPVSAANEKGPAKQGYAVRTLTGNYDDAAGEEEKPAAKKTARIHARDSYVKAFQKKGTFTIRARINSGAKLRFRSANPKVVKVNSRTGLAKIKGYGETTITIRAKATKEYTAPEEQTVTVQIVPAKMRWEYVTSPTKKAVSAKWKIDKTVSGYQIQFCKSASFSGEVFKNNVVVKKGHTYYNRYTWSGFLKGKTYYFRIRAYKKVKNQTLWGDWSSVKGVRIHS